MIFVVGMNTRNDIVVLGNISKNRLNYYVWKDAIDEDIITYIPNLYKNNLLKKIHTILTSGKFEDNIPFHKLILELFNFFFKRFYINSIPNTAKLVIFSHISLVSHGHILKDLCNKGVKSVLFLFDSIQTLDPSVQKQIKQQMHYFSAVYSFDNSDCKNYGFYKWEQIYSPLSLVEGKYRYDVYFAGRDKGRAKELLDFARFASEKGLCCCFRIPDLNEHYKKEFMEVLGDNFKEELVSYDKVLEEINRTRCILEILQHNQFGISWRAVEAFFYNKKLITTFSDIKHNKYFNSKYIHIYSELKDIDYNWIMNYCFINYNYKGDYSPIQFIQEVKTKFL